MNRRRARTENYRELMRHTAEPGPKEIVSRPVCTEHSHCEGCPYPAHGFVCWGDEERCMRKIVQNESYNTKKGGK